MFSAEVQDVASKCRRLARVERDVDLGRVDRLCDELIILTIMAVVVLVPGVLRILGGARV